MKRYITADILACAGEDVKIRQCGDDTHVANISACTDLYCDLSKLKDGEKPPVQWHKFVGWNGLATGTTMFGAGSIQRGDQFECKANVINHTFQSTIETEIEGKLYKVPVERFTTEYHIIPSTFKNLGQLKRDAINRHNNITVAAQGKAAQGAGKKAPAKAVPA